MEFRAEMTEVPQVPQPNAPGGGIIHSPHCCEVPATSDSFHLQGAEAANDGTTMAALDAWVYISSRNLLLLAVEAVTGPHIWKLGQSEP